VDAEPRRKHCGYGEREYSSGAQPQKVKTNTFIKAQKVLVE
jgi:hypothetical protein